MTALAPIQNQARLRAVTLVRVSSAEQAELGRSGIDRQRESNDSAVRSQGYQLVKSFEIIDVSGASSFASPEMIELVSMVEAGTVDVVVASEMSRIHRPSDLASLGAIDVLKQHGTLLNIGGTIHNLSEPEGFLSSGIMSIIGGFERLSMIKKLLAAKESSRAKGLCPGSRITLPTGLSYCRLNNRYHYNDEIWKVQLAFELIDLGERNLSEVARQVAIHHRTLKNLLANTYVTGVRSYTMVRDQSRKTLKANARQGDRPKIPRTPDKIIRVRIIPAEEQAVSDERFERVQSVLAQMAEHHARYVAPSKGLNVLTGIGRCACCGERLYTATSSRRIEGEKVRGHYLCKSHYYLFKGKISTCSQSWLRRDRMEEIVSAFVIHFLTDSKFVTSILSHAQSKRENIIGIDSVPETIRRQLSDIESRDRRMLEAIEAGAVSLAEAKLRRSKLETDKQALLLTLQRTEAQGNEPSIPSGMLGKIASLGAKAWTGLTCPRERKALLATLFMEIYVQGESITAFRLAPSLVGASSGDWGWVAQIPVTLPTPFRLAPPPKVVVIPDGHRQCSRCQGVLPTTEFYPKLAACKPCINADNNARYAAKVAAKKALQQE